LAGQVPGQAWEREYETKGGDTARRDAMLPIMDANRKKTPIACVAITYGDRTL
jgi:hypothetical protein